MRSLKTDWWLAWRSWNVWDNNSNVVTFKSDLFHVPSDDGREHWCAFQKQWTTQNIHENPEQIEIIQTESRYMIYKVNSPFSNDLLRNIKSVNVEEYDNNDNTWQGEYHQMWPRIPFSTSTSTAQSNPIDMEEILSYELSAFPLSLCEIPILLREADKPKLAEGIEKFVKEHSSTDKSGSTLYITETLIDSKVENCDKEKQVHGTTTTTDSYGDSNHQYVLHGGSLLHRICWAKDNTCWNSSLLFTICSMQIC